MVSFKDSRRCRAKVLAGCLAVSLLTTSYGSAAATTDAALAVSVTVSATCTVAANPLFFGSYFPGGGSLNANTTLLVRCSRGAPFTVAMDAGGSGNLLERLMTQGSSSLEYNLYTTAARTTLWGNGSAGSAVVSGTGRGLAGNEAITETVYGELPDNAANQLLASGTYSDTIRVTVSY
jgi:spore coat protein U-like protein